MNVIFFPVYVLLSLYRRTNCGTNSHMNITKLIPSALFFQSNDTIAIVLINNCQLPYHQIPA